MYGRISPGSSYNQAPFAKMSTPNVSWRNRVTTPWMPIVAMKANASMTPPNWASTPAAASTDCRNHTPSGFMPRRA